MKVMDPNVYHEIMLFASELRPNIRVQKKWNESIFS